MRWARAKKVQNGQQNVSYEDTTMGLRRISADAPDVATVAVDLDMGMEHLAWLTGVDTACPDPSRAQGFRDGLVMPSGADFLVLVLIYPEQSLGYRMGLPAEGIEGQRIGRFPSRERRRWLDVFHGRNVKGILFIDVPSASVQFRFRPGRIGEGPVASSSETSTARRCGQCGRGLRSGVQFCTHCGSPVS